MQEVVDEVVFEFEEMKLLVQCRQQEIRDTRNMECLVKKASVWDHS